MTEDQLRTAFEDATYAYYIELADKAIAEGQPVIEMVSKSGMFWREADGTYGVKANNQAWFGFKAGAEAGNRIARVQSAKLAVALDEPGAGARLDAVMKSSDWADAPAAPLTDDQIDRVWMFRYNLHDGDLRQQLRDFARNILALRDAA